MSAPSVLFASSSENCSPDDLVKQILNVHELPSSNCVTQNVFAYNWHIDTKYYTTNVQLCTTNERTIGDQAFADTVEAFIIYFDPSKTESFQLVKAWIPYLEQIEPEIQILVCENCSHDNTVNQLTAQTWCIENNFELVELNPLNDDEDDDDVENDFEETTGIKRIIQALHAHSWPNLRLKENPDIRSPYFKQLMQEEADKRKEENKCEGGNVCDDDKLLLQSAAAEHTCEHSTEEFTLQTAGEDNFSKESENKLDNSSSLAENKDKSKEMKEQKDKAAELGSEKKGNSDDKRKVASEKPKDEKNKPETAEDRIDSLLPLDDLSLFAALGDEGAGSESFEQLFNQLSTMKQTASKLPPSERKIYAEKIAIKFWKAIGGDEDEIAGLSDNDEPS